MATNVPQVWATVSYGDVTFELRNTVKLSREPEFSENGTYLYHKITLEFEATYNPSATSYAANALNGQGSPIATKNALPAATDRALREYLMQPRRPLIYRFGSDIVVQSPPLVGSPTGLRVAPCDVNNGPIPESCSIVSIHGMRTFVVAMKISTCVREDWARLPFIAHYWSQSVYYDQDRIGTIVTEGRCIFNAAVLQSLGTYPDRYRKSFSHPVPPGCERGPIVIKASADGNTIDYKIEDRYTTNVIDATCNPSGNGPNGKFGFPARFEAWFSAGYSQVGTEAATRQLNLGIATGILDLSSSIAGNPTRGTAASAVALGAFQLARLSSHAASSRVPNYHRSIVVKCWGSPFSNRWDMICWAMGIAVTRCNIKDQAYTNALTITEGLHCRYIEVEISQIIPASVVAFSGGGDILPGMQPGEVPQNDFTYNGINTTLAPFFLNKNEEIKGGFGNQNPPVSIKAFVTSDTSKAARLMTPENDNPPIVLGRANFFAKLVAQALSEPCSLPPQIVAPWPLSGIDVKLYS